MNKFYKLISVILLIFAGCESEEIVTPDMGYEELLVVQCEIKGNQEFPGVRLTKTLPIGVDFTIEQAEIKDATMYIKINGAQVIPLLYTSEGMYKSLYSFTVNLGDAYELFAERGDQTIYAKTIIPLVPVINSVSYNSNNKCVEASVKTIGDEVYGALWVVSSGRFITADNFYNISSPTNSENQIITVRSTTLPDNYQASSYNGRRYIQVLSFDSSFTDYFNTSEVSGSVNNPYVQGSGNTIWNVKGKNVIGMFIGLASSKYLFVN